MTNSNWTRGEPWGTLQSCEDFNSCSDYLDVVGTRNNVLEAECRPLRIASHMTKTVCTCSTRQLRIGKNCEQLTLFSFVGMVVSILVLLFCSLVLARSLKVKHLQHQIKLTWYKPAALAGTSGVFAAVSSNAWMIGKVIRFLTFDKGTHQIGIELINTFAVPTLFLFTMAGTMLVCIAWIKVAQVFMVRKKKSASQMLLKLERFLYASLGVMSVAVLAFMLQRNYFVSLALCIVSQLPLIPGILYSGGALKTMMSSTQTGNKKATSRAIRSITLYTKWIAASMTSNVLFMVAFAFVDTVPIYSQADDAFHPAVLIEQLLCFSIASTTNSVLGYIQHSICNKKRRVANNANANTSSAKGNKVSPSDVSSTASSE